MSKINITLSGVSSSPQNIIICIPKWPQTLGSTSAKLSPANVNAFATFCGNLADIVANQLRFPQVTEIEILNEVDNLYNTVSDLNELKTICDAARAAIAAKTSAISAIPASWTQPYDPLLGQFLRLLNLTEYSAVSYHHYATSGNTANITALYQGARTIGSQSGSFRRFMNTLPNGVAARLYISETNLYTVFSNDLSRLMKTNIGGTAYALTWLSCVRSRVQGNIATDSLMLWNDADGTYGAMDSAAMFGLRPTGAVLQQLRSSFSVGSEVNVGSSTANLTAIATIDGTQRKVMILNVDSAPHDLDLVFTGNNFPSSSGNIAFIQVNADYNFAPSLIPYSSGIAPTSILVKANSVNFLLFP